VCDGRAGGNNLLFLVALPDAVDILIDILFARKPEGLFGLGVLKWSAESFGQVSHVPTYETFLVMPSIYPRLLSFLFRPSFFLLRTIKNKKREEGEGGKARRGKAEKGEARE